MTKRDKMLQELATTLLCDSVASEVESETQGTESQITTPEIAERIQARIIYPRADLTLTIPDLARELGMDLSKYLPTDLIERIETAYNKCWATRANPLTLERLYSHSPRAAHRLVMNAVGHGIGPTDDSDDAEYMSRFLDDADARPDDSFESPYAEAAEFVADAAKLV